jgi:hypothetical protein
VPRAAQRLYVAALDHVAPPYLTETSYQAINYFSHLKTMQHPRLEEAFHWIVGILRKHDMPFQLSGGMAAHVYGSGRPINDIDIEVPNARLAELVPDVREFLEEGPFHLVDERWDLDIMVLNYHGQILDMCGDKPVRICDARTGTWCDMPSDLSTARMMTVFGVEIPVVDPEKLADYKVMLAGDHQKIDVAAVQEYLRKRSEKNT